jgi:hypothetical protein
MHSRRGLSEEFFPVGLVQAGCSKRRILICRGSEIREMCAAQLGVLALRPNAYFFGKHAQVLVNHVSGFDDVRCTLLAS